MRQFKSKYDGYHKAKRIWVCKSCKTWANKKPVICPICEHKEFYYFASEIEAQRFAELQLLLCHELITELETQVNYYLIVDDYPITTYRADFVYKNYEGELVVEDVKANMADKHLTEAFKIKCRLMKALYNIDVQIIKRS